MWNRWIANNTYEVAYVSCKAGKQRPTAWRVLSAMRPHGGVFPTDGREQWAPEEVLSLLPLKEVGK